MKVQFLGSGDAFGSGGRMQTCTYAHQGQNHFLIDCGSSAMIGIRKYGVDPNLISHIFLTHLHGDHFGGIPFFLLDAQMISKRGVPLRIIGPVGTKARILALMELLFPGSSKVQQKYTLEIKELETGGIYGWSDLQVQSFQAQHPSGAEATALQICWANKKLVYTGDTEWQDSLREAIQGVDLLIAEAYYFEKKIKFHLDYQTLLEKSSSLGVKRMIITHMSADMLGNLSKIQCDSANDGQEYQI